MGVLRMKTYLVTGGAGFLGAALVKKLLAAGNRVRVLDNLSRGAARRLEGASGDIEFIEGDVRDAAAVKNAARGVDVFCHLAFVNGTEFFYTKPELVLDVGVRGMLNALDACVENRVPEFVLASSSEAYQTPAVVPTPEDVPLVVPDVLNARYSYGAGKLISEVMLVNWARTRFKRAVIFRPHNVYGPDMGWEHVVPQFALRMKRLSDAQSSGTLQFRIQGSGRETRAFVHVDDFTDGLMLVVEKGAHLGIYHIGTSEETSIAELAHHVAAPFGRSIELVPGEAAKGGTLRRCPDIRKLEALGYKPRVLLAEGVRRTAEWYAAHAHMAPNAKEPVS